MINHCEVIKHMLVKDFSNFSDHGAYSFETYDPMSTNLFFLTGERWRNMRTKLSPTFSPGKLKKMFPLVQEVADEFADAISDDLRSSNEVDVAYLVKRYTATQ